jgi:hypothetical protein
MTIETEVAQLVTQTKQLDVTIKTEIVDINSDVESLRDRVTNLEIQTGIPTEGGLIPNAGGDHPTEPTIGVGNEVIKIDEESEVIYLWDPESDAWVSIPFTTISPEIAIDVDSIIAQAQAAIDDGIQLTVDELIASIESTVLDTQQTQLDNLASTVTTHGTSIDYNTAAIQQETTARIDGDTAISEQLTTLAAEVDGNNQAFLAFQAAVVADPDGAAAEYLQNLQSQIEDNTANLATEISTRANQTESLSTQVTTLTTSVQNAQTAVQSEITARTSADNALTTRIDNLVAEVDGNSAAISSVQQAVSGFDGSLAESVETLQTTVNGLTTTVSDVSSSVDGIEGRRTLTVNANGQVTGVQLLSGANVGSQIKFAANSFIFYDPNTGVETVPFSIIGGTTYIKKAAIGEAWIDSEKIEPQSATILSAGEGNTVVAATMPVGVASTYSVPWIDIVSTQLTLDEPTTVQILVYGNQGYRDFDWTGNHQTTYQALFINGVLDAARGTGAIVDTPSFGLVRTLPAGTHTLSYRWNGTAAAGKGEVEMGQRSIMVLASKR